jgi:hypothetical protein
MDKVSRTNDVALLFLILGDSDSDNAVIKENGCYKRVISQTHSSPIENDQASVV